MSPPRRSKRISVAGLHQELIDAVAVLLTQARSALFITGPGMSLESGLAQFRGIPGLDRKPEDATLRETALSIETMRSRPGVTWKYLREMDAQVRSARPNAGHEVLAGFERELKRSAIMTLNTDRLHQRAGSRSVIEMHGALHDLLCSRCELSTRHDTFDDLEAVPLCTTCGNGLRPDMPLFGETLPADPFTRLQEELEIGFDLVFAIGVGTMAPYIARPILLARSEGIPTVEITTGSSDISEIVDFRFRGSPMGVLGMIWDAYRQLPRRTRPA